jgi:hypothetical protein
MLWSLVHAQVAAAAESVASRAATSLESDRTQAEQQLSQLVSTQEASYASFVPQQSAAWNTLLQEADVEGQLAAGEQAAGQQLVRVHAATFNHAAPAGSCPTP